MHRPRLRKLTLWTGTLLSLLIAAAFVLSAWWDVVLQVHTPYGLMVGLFDGMVAIDLSDSPLDVVFVQRKPSAYLPNWNRWAIGTWGVMLPIYALFLAVLLTTLLVWRLVPKFPRGHCRRCGYNLRG